MLHSDSVNHGSQVYDSRPMDTWLGKAKVILLTITMHSLHTTRFYILILIIPIGCKLEAYLRAKVSNPVVETTPLLLIVLEIFHLVGLLSQYANNYSCHIRVMSQILLYGSILPKESEQFTRDCTVASCLHQIHTKQHTHWNVSNNTWHCNLHCS